MITMIITLMATVSSLIVCGSMIILKPMKYFFSFQNYELVEKLGNKENDFELLTYNPETDSYIK